MSNFFYMSMIQLEQINLIDILYYIIYINNLDKSYLIETLSSHLFATAARYRNTDPIFRTAPTGITAFDINSYILYRLL